MIPQYVIDYHYQSILDAIKSKDKTKISLMLACINYLKNRPGFQHIDFASQNAVMHGWLTVTDQNTYAVKESKPSAS